MRKYISPSRSEVLGQVALSLLENLNVDEIRPILEKYQLSRLEPDVWYPTQLYLDIFREIAEGRTNSIENMVAIGMKVAQLVRLPPGLTLGDLLVAYDKFHRSTIRNQTPEDGFISEVLGEDHITIINNTPIPDDVMFGVFWGFAQRLLPRGSNFLIRPLTRAHPDSDESTTFDITWGKGYKSPTQQTGSSGAEFNTIEETA